MAFTQKGSGYFTTIWDTIPVLPPTAGEGAPSFLCEIEDSVAIAQTGAGTSGNFWRLCRFPVKAKIKKLDLYVDIASGLVDGGGASTALVFSVGVAFSDSTIDGTPPSLQNQMPTTVGIGGGSTTPGTTVAIGGTSSNRLFGTVTAVAATGAFGTLQGVGTSSNLWGTDVTFGGGTTYQNALIGPSSTLNTTALALIDVPVLEIFNLQDGRGNVIKDEGFFDLIVIVNTIYNTQPGAGYNLYAKLQYSV